ncbi:NAD(P)H-hydrate dehydratase [Dongia sp.]|uniref:NAD(P)H-hydrate dehydratase n=1 Tax=Dongia sp. TaxID=1977262 RepID=UPI0035B0D73C
MAPDAKNMSGPLDLVLTSAQMRAAEQALFDRGVDSFALMRDAGRAVADHVQQFWPGHKVTVLCGPGNNGGDGFIVAELLRQAGRDVTLLAMRPVDGYRNDAAKAAAGWQGTTLPMNHATLATALAPESLVIDALFGIGLDRPLDDMAVAAIHRCRQLSLPVVAVDIPSGISADTGQVLGAAFAASDTVTFGWPKPGHLLLPGRLHAGRLVVAPLGFDAACGREAQSRSAVDIRANGLDVWLMHLPRVGALDHKYSRGHALVFGSQAMPGAGRLAARAARRIGAGMLTVAAPAEVLPLYMADQPGLIAKPAARAEDVVEILMDSRITALLVGSGMLPDDATREAVLNALASARAAVIDGGGLTAFADRPQELFGLGRADVVLTPHEGEFARLFPDLDVELGKAERARLAAERSRCTIVLKGADTVIAQPPSAIGDAQQVRLLINREASPHLATAGSGDVLAGLVLGLLAQGMPAFEAAAAAVWFHSEAGFAAGPGLIAEDLPERIPEIRRLLES